MSRFIFVMLFGVMVTSGQIVFANQPCKHNSLSGVLANQAALTDSCKVKSPELKDVIKIADEAREYEQCISRAFTEVRIACGQNLSAQEYVALLELQRLAISDAAEITSKTNAVATEAMAEVLATKSFMDVSLGVGFGFSFADDDAIEEAVVVDDVVRVTKDQSDQARAILEFHNYVWCKKNNGVRRTGCGPFVAVAATSDEVLSGVGLGFMYGWKSIKGGEDDGFSIGIGAILDNNVKSLADGFTADQPLPAGETDVRFEEKSRWSLLIFATRTF